MKRRPVERPGFLSARRFARGGAYILGAGGGPRAGGYIGQNLDIVT